MAGDVQADTVRTLAGEAVEESGASGTNGSGHGEELGGSPCPFLL